MKRRFTILSFYLAAVLLPVLLEAQPTQEIGIVSSGATANTSDSYSGISIVGHSLVVTASSGNFQLASGFVFNADGGTGSGGSTISNITYTTPYDLSSTELIVTAGVSDDVGISAVSIRYRNSTDTQATSVPMTDDDGDGTFEGAIPNSAFDNQGVFFFIRAINNEDGVTNSAEEFVALTPSGSPPDITSSIGTGSLNTDYRILTIPFTGAAVTAVLEELGELEYRSDWRMFEYRNGYTDKNSGNFEPGKGYKILVRDRTSVSIDVGESVPVNRDEPFSMPLQADWNLIGNPFLSRISWNEVIQYNIDQGIISDGDVSEVYTFNGSYATGTSLNVFQGAFVRAANGAIADFVIPVTATNGGRVLTESRPKSAYFTNESDWLLKLEMTSETYNYHLSGIGMHPEARDGLDGRDTWTPPRFFDYLETNFELTGRDDRVSTSVVAPQEDFKWTFHLSTNLNDAAMQWDKELLNQLPGYFLLRDVEDNVTYNMKSQNHLTLRSTEDKRYEIIYTQELSGELLESIKPLGDAYPNPFTNQVKIPFEVAGREDSYHVQLDILSMEGRRIKRLVDDVLKPGSYEITWWGENDGNGLTTNGLYLYRLSYGDRNIPLKKLILQK